MTRKNDLCLFLNNLDDSARAQALESCCASKAWIRAMLQKAPWETDQSIYDQARQSSLTLSEQDWLEAFDAHPEIGDISSLKEKYAQTARLASHEQSSVRGADESTLLELRRMNLLYKEKFGFVFLIFATGKSADEILSSLKERYHYTREQELREAASQQQEITLLRLQKLVSSSSN